MLMAPWRTSAQGTVNDLTTDLCTRTSLGLDYKIAKGLHLEAEYELRTEDNLSKIDRHQASFGVSYKINSWLRAGASYTYIYRQGSDYWAPRHRVNADVTFGFKTGSWRFSLKEQLRYTYKTEDLNEYQEARNAFLLKSRLKAQYKGFAKIEPYAYVEVRNTLNDPTCSATWSTVDEAYSDYSFLGYTSVYVNRVRGALGLEWKLDKHNSIDFYALLDYCYDKNIDTDKAGTKLKSLTYDQALNTSLGIGYKFSF